MTELQQVWALRRHEVDIEVYVDETHSWLCQQNAIVWAIVIHDSHPTFYLSFAPLGDLLTNLYFACQPTIFCSPQLGVSRERAL